MRCIKAISQTKHGEWMRWKSVEQRKIGWQDLWSMEESRVSFLIRLTYDVLPSPQNLNLWVGEDPSCPSYSSPATLRDILTGYKLALNKGRFTWHHGQVLQCLALALEGNCNMPNKFPPVLSKHYTQKSNHQEKVLKPVLAQVNWKLLGTGKCCLIMINGLFFHLRLPPLTSNQILFCGLDQHALFN